MGLTMNIDVEVLGNSLGGMSNVKEYLEDLQTQQVMFLNGPESPGVCLRCLSYHRTVWKRDDASRPREPLHPNCYCRTVSYRPTKAATLKRKDKYTFLREQLSRLSLKQKQNILGVGVNRLYRLGIVEVNDMVKASTGQISLGQHLTSKLGITPEQFNKFSDGDLIKIFEQHKATK